MTPTARATTPHVYVECDVPDGLTLVEWRRSRSATTQVRPARRILRRRVAQPASGGDTHVGVRASDS